MNKYCGVIPLFLLLITSNIFSMSKIAKVTTMRPIFDFVDKIVCSGDKSKFKKILFIFDLNKTLMVPADDRLGYYFKDEFDRHLEAFCKEPEIHSNVTTLRSAITNRATFKIGDKGFINLLSMIKTNGFKAIAISESKFGKWGVINSLSDFILSKLSGLNVSFEFINPCSCSDKSFFSEEEDLMFFKDGVLFYGGKPLSAVIRSLLEALKRIVNWQPKLIIFIDSLDTDLTMADSGLSSWNCLSKQKIYFYGFHYKSLCESWKKIDTSDIVLDLYHFHKTGNWSEDVYSRSCLDVDMTDSQIQLDNINPICSVIK